MASRFNALRLACLCSVVPSLVFLMGIQECSNDDQDSDGFSVEEGDCNDDNDQVYPGAEELCDELDNDCDGSVDEDVELSTYYRDADEDGHGDPTSSIQACRPVKGYVASSDDCDDTNGKVYPGAPEQPGDSVDSNCNGYMDFLQILAGNGSSGFSGDGGPGDEASLGAPASMAADELGNVYIADTRNNRIRLVTPDGMISTVAGTGAAGMIDGPATQAKLNSPSDVAVDRSGDVYIADTGNNRIRKITTLSGVTRLVTVAGTGVYGYEGDGGPAEQANLKAPRGVAVGPAGAVVFADTENHRVREISVNGTLSTVAGCGTAGYGGDGGLAVDARLNLPYGVDVDANGAMYIADTGNNIIRMVSVTGTITKIAGEEYYPGYDGDGIPATKAKLNAPTSVATDDQFNLYIADSKNNRVRKIFAVTGNITTVAGTGAPDAMFVGEGTATEIDLSQPYGVSLDYAGNLLIGDTGNDRVRILFW